MPAATVQKERVPVRRKGREAARPRRGVEGLRRGLKPLGWIPKSAFSPGRAPDFRASGTPSLTFALRLRLRAARTRHDKSSLNGRLLYGRLRLGMRLGGGRGRSPARVKPSGQETYVYKQGN